MLADALGHFGVERLTLYIGKLRVNAEVAFGLEGLDFAFALHDEADRNGLYAARAEASLHFFPEHGGELKADNSVQDASRLLGVHQVHVDASGLLDGLDNSAFGNLVKDNAVGL